MAATNASTWSNSRTSAGRKVTRSGSDSGSVRPQITTWAPASTNRCVMPRPTPRAPPVTRTTWPPKSSAESRATDMGEYLATPMGITTKVTDHVAEVVMDNPPVNALTVAGWYDVARQVTEAGEDPDVLAVVLRAEGRGFNA